MFIGKAGTPLLNKVHGFQIKRCRACSSYSVSCSINMFFFLIFKIVPSSMVTCWEVLVHLKRESLFSAYAFGSFLLLSVDKFVQKKLTVLTLCNVFPPVLSLPLQPGFHTTRSTDTVFVKVIRNLQVIRSPLSPSSTSSLACWIHLSLLLEHLP